VSHDQEEHLLRHLAAHGIRGVREDEWTPEIALDHVREQRRRYAGTPRVEKLGRAGRDLVEHLAGRTSLPPGDVAMVLLVAGAYAASIGLLGGASGTEVGEIMQCAADDLDQQAKAGEQL
jgi:hypothetical protein